MFVVKNRTYKLNTHLKTHVVHEKASPRAIASSSDETTSSSSSSSPSPSSQQSKLGSTGGKWRVRGAEYNNNGDVVGGKKKMGYGSAKAKLPSPQASDT